MQPKGKNGNEFNAILNFLQLNYLISLQEEKNFPFFVLVNLKLVTAKHLSAITKIKEQMLIE